MILSLKPMRTLLLISTLLLTGLFSACNKEKGDGPVLTENRSVADFNEIESNISGDVEVTFGESYRVEVRAAKNIIELTETKVASGKLMIRFKKPVSIGKNETFIVRVYTPYLKSLALSGSGNLELLNAVQSNSLKLQLTGSGNIELPSYFGSELDVRLAGSGNIRIHQGTVIDERLILSGSGNIDLEQVQATRADAQLTGSGNIRLFVTGDLMALITGSGNIYYRGTPVINSQITGSGQLIPLD